MKAIPATASTKHRDHFTAGIPLLAILALLFMASPRPVLAAADSLGDYRKAVSTVVSSLNRRSPTVLNRTIDADKIVDKALSGLAMEATFRRNFTAGLKKGLSNLGGKLLQLLPEGRSAKLIRVDRGDGLVKGLVRMDYGDSGWGYMDFWLARDSKGKVRIIDWYDFSSGQLYTRSLQQIAIIASPTPTTYGKVFDVVTGRKKDIKTISSFVIARAKKDFNKSYSIFKNMDTRLRKNRIVGIVAVASASQSGNDEYYREALANLAKHHGDDPNLAFLLIDHYFYNKKYDRAIENLDRFQADLGADDAAIDGLKANIYLMAGNNRRATEYATKGIRTEPDLDNNYWTLFNLYATSGQHTRAIAIGKQLENRFRYDLGPASLKGQKDYQTLLKSSAYRNWQGF